MQCRINIKSIDKIDKSNVLLATRNVYKIFNKFNLKVLFIIQPDYLASIIPPGLLYYQ